MTFAGTNRQFSKICLVVVVAVAVIFSSTHLTIPVFKNSSYAKSELETFVVSSACHENCRTDFSTLNLLVADNWYKKYKGLSGRPFLSELDGMIFLFEEPLEARFVMRDMRFNLDFWFLNDKGKIVEVVRNVSFNFDGEIVSSQKILAVIEIPSTKPAVEILKVGAVIKPAQ